MSDHEKKPDYGGPDPRKASWALAIVLIAIAAGLRIFLKL
jgi:hypothetical protein